jgi:hypothetical protein
MFCHRKPMVAITVAGALTVFAAHATLANSTLAQDGPPFGSEEDVEFAQELWTTLESANLVGEDRINVRPFEGNEPHGSIQQVLATTATLGGRSDRVVVKVNHGGEGANVDSVYDNPNEFLGAYTVMFKRESGYDPENQDWFWAKYGPDGSLDKNPKGVPLAGRVAKGMDSGCIACHTAAGGGDLEVLTSQ